MSLLSKEMASNLPLLLVELEKVSLPVFVETGRRLWLKGNFLINKDTYHV